MNFSNNYYKFFTYNHRKYGKLLNVTKLYLKKDEQELKKLISELT